MDVEGHLRQGRSASLAYTGEVYDEAHVFRGKVTGDRVGQYGFAVRVVPNVDRMKKKFEPGLITWG